MTAAIITAIAIAFLIGAYAGLAASYYFAPTFNDELHEQHFTNVDAYTEERELCGADATDTTPTIGTDGES